MKKWITKNIKKTDKKDIIIFLIPFVVFMIYWIIFYPGALSYDSYNQLEQIRNMKFTTSHPFFHTFIEMVLMKIWNSPAIIGLFQISVFSILWTKICKYNRSKFNKKESKFDLCFLFQILITLFIIINPLNDVMSITLWKDVLYSYVILWLCFRLEILIDKKFKVNLKEIVLLSFILVLVYALRHNGLIITIGVGTILFIMFIIKNKKSFNYLKLLLFIVIFFFGFKGLEFMFKVNEGTSVKITSSIIDAKIFTMASYIAREGEISTDEIADLSKYINYDKLKASGRYNLMDIIWGYCEVNNELINKEKKEFYSLMYNLALKNAKVTFKYFLNETAFIWRVVRLDDSYGYLLKYDSYATNSGENYYIQKNENTKLYQIFESNIKLSFENKLYQTIYYSGSLYLYISIICLIIISRKFKKRYLLVLTPILLNIIGLVLTMPVNDVRYYYSSFLGAYLLMVILGKYIFNEEKV